jgi:alanyl-tRNA synthetase
MAAHEHETEKLYWSDPHVVSFETTGAELAEHDGKPSIVLPRTLFYPEGGGQLGDRGTLAVLVPGGPSLEVTDTQTDERGVIHHLIAARPDGIAADAAVRGSVDQARRRDHMTQHTGQHALSRALADVARAETVSARLGATTCTIDVGRPGLADADLHRAEDLANDVIANDVPVRPLYPTADELSRLPLRKAPKVTEGTIRIIEIEGFDLTPCGGTHCTRTGQIGQIRIVGTEKYKGMLRITFHAGQRALEDARAKHAALSALAAALTCGLGDVPDAVGKLRAELKGSRARLDEVRAELADLVAARALAALAGGTGGAGAGANPIILPLLRENDDVGSLRLIAGKLAAGRPGVVALVAALDPATGELVVVVQREGGASFDCGAFIQAQARARSGRGGGRPERAEGRFPKGVSLEALADEARARLV